MPLCLSLFGAKKFNRSDGTLNAEFSKPLQGPGVNSKSFLYYSNVVRSGHSEYFSGVFKEAFVMTVRLKAYSQRVEGKKPVASERYFEVFRNSL